MATVTKVILQIGKIDSRKRPVKGQTNSGYGKA